MVAIADCISLSDPRRAGNEGAIPVPAALHGPSSSSRSGPRAQRSGRVTGHGAHRWRRFVARRRSSFRQPSAGSHLELLIVAAARLAAVRCDFGPSPDCGRWMSAAADARLCAAWPPLAGRGHRPCHRLLAVAIAFAVTFAVVSDLDRPLPGRDRLAARSAASQALVPSGRCVRPRLAVLRRGVDFLTARSASTAAAGRAVVSMSTTTLNPAARKLMGPPFNFGSRRTDGRGYRRCPGVRRCDTSGSGASEDAWIRPRGAVHQSAPAALWVIAMVSPRYPPRLQETLCA